MVLATFDEAVSRADILILLVDHAEFKSVKPGWSDGKVLIDTRGIWRGIK
jgi:UDP-N-acetyl-D-mannosaminuronic acid dehydrogenase